MIIQDELKPCPICGLLPTIVCPVCEICGGNGELYTIPGDGSDAHPCEYCNGTGRVLNTNGIGGDLGPRIVSALERLADQGDIHYSDAAENKEKP